MPRHPKFFYSDSDDEFETAFDMKTIAANRAPPPYTRPATLPVTQQNGQHQLPRMRSMNPAEPSPMTSSDPRGQPPRMTSINHRAQPPRMTSINHGAQPQRIRPSNHDENFRSDSYGTTLRIEDNDEVPRQDDDKCCVCNKTTARRSAYAAIVILMMIGITIPLVYLLSGSNNIKDEIKEPPWCVPRETWGAQQTELQSKPDSFKLVQMMVIQHYITPECYTHEDCSITLRNIQQQYIDSNRVDVPYNFFIGGNGVVYEGRGWEKVGLDSGRFDECSISIGFIGDYDKIEVQQIQLDRAKLIIETGIRDHYIDPEHVIVGAKDITSTTSPGQALYLAIMAFERYDHEHRNQNNTCNDIHGIWEPPPNNAKWLVTREEWESQEIELPSKPDPFQPVQMVVIQNSLTRDCFDQDDCSVLLRSIQYNFVSTNRTDVPYNFFIDINGLVYEGRGWGKVGRNSGRFDACSISIGFIGDYDKIKVQQIQLDRAKLIIETGIRDHYIDPEHVIVGAKDITSTTSPGQSLYDAIREFERYDHENRHENSTCHDIHDVDLPGVVPDWFVKREEWGSDPYRANHTDPKYLPAKLVVINNSISRVCHTFETCVAELGQLQYWIMQDTGSDVAYNFAIGNDGRVYEMRGWGYLSGAVNRAVHHCEINIGFIGEYVTGSPYEAHLTNAQVNRTKMLLDEGLRLGYLDENYVVLGARDVSTSRSPAEELYNEIQTWDRYDHECNLCGRDCDSIHGAVASDDGEKRRS